MRRSIYLSRTSFVTALMLCLAATAPVFGQQKREFQSGYGANHAKVPTGRQEVLELPIIGQDEKEPNRAEEFLAKSPGTALLISILGALSPLPAAYLVRGVGFGVGPTVAAAVGATIIGPSGGHIYTEDYTRVAITSLIRLVAVYFEAMAIGAAFAELYSQLTWGGETERDTTADFYAFMGGMLLLSSTVYDIVDSYYSALRYNRKHLKKSSKTVNWYVAPALQSLPGGQTATRGCLPGLNLGILF